MHFGDIHKPRENRGEVGSRIDHENFLKTSDSLVI